MKSVVIGPAVGVERHTTNLFFQAGFQREFFLTYFSNRETIAVTEANNYTYCHQKRVEKFPLEQFR